MSREIKFRAWDKSRMIHFSDFSIGLKKGKKVEPYVYFLSDTFNGEVKLGNHEIMQYTGLKDKNGVEIYEGDILMLGTGTYLVQWDLISWNPKVLVKYKDVMANNYFPSWYFHNKESIIIGNIYQNPELL